MKIITIDGPAGAGKGITAKLLAQRLNYYHLDSGALYRIVSLYLLRKDIRPNELDKIISKVQEIDIKITQLEDKTSKFYLNGQDVTDDIRTEEVSSKVADYAKIPEIREFVKKQQVKICQDMNIVAEGRDTGSEIFPNADLKIYLTADFEVRAERRFKELVSKGKNVDFDKVKEELRQRDYLDLNREISPLRVPEDARILDNTNLTIDQQVDIIYKWFLEIQSKDNENK
ncbi:(d)CMP kinase [Candidatus Dojkabacteria bacterium]|uniref:Cytidylate kinase n=1 Tax=Candidatus Dojkabacteria bacterium TaxID=2099670 RepID=A0A3M0YYC1_9BACT|nr:MAG: (d)CMP kinase [Candidatus Dojkabacteria bacterium]